MRSTDILIVDDEIGIREVLQETLEDEGYTVALAENAEEARRLRNQTRPAMVLLDIWMPDSDGITLLKEWAKNGQLTMPVVMMSGHGSIDTAVEATKIGALDFLEKPITLQKLLATVEHALKAGEAQTQGQDAAQLGNAPALLELERHLAQAQQQGGPVLICGESGMPFGLLARRFHKQGAAWAEAVKPEQLVDAPMELLQKAAGGVLYVGDIAQYGKSARQAVAFLIGKAERHHVRVVCASSSPVHELAAEAEADARVQALLGSALIQLPALADWEGDIGFLLKGVLPELVGADAAAAVCFSAEAVQALGAYAQQGSLPQWRSVVRSVVLNAAGAEIGAADVAQVLQPLGGAVPCSDTSGFNFNLPLRELREEVERRYFEYHIRNEGNNMSQVASKVGLERTHLYRKLKQLGIHVTRRGNGDRDLSE